MRVTEKLEFDASQGTVQWTQLTDVVLADAVLKNCRRAKEDSGEQFERMEAKRCTYGLDFREKRCHMGVFGSQRENLGGEAILERRKASVGYIAQKLTGEWG